MGSSKKYNKNLKPDIDIVKNARKLVAKYSEEAVVKKWLKLIEEIHC